MKNHIESYNKWLSGNSNRAEHHKLQKEGLDNPMIGDALEGVELHHLEDRDKIISDLDKKLSNKVLKPNQETKVFSLWPYAVAAGLALLFSSIFFLRNDNEVSNDIIVGTVESNVMESDVVALQIEPDRTEEIAVENKREVKENSRTSSPPVKKEISPEIKTKADAPRQVEKPASELAVQIVEQSPSEDLAIKDQSIEMANESEPISLVQAPPTSTDIASAIQSSEELEAEPAKIRSQGGLSQIAKKSQEQEGKAALMQNTKSFARAQVNSASPEIGEEAFKEILRANPFAKDELFMRNLKKGDSIIISFNLDNNGYPVNIESKGFETEVVVKILKESGKWIAPDHKGQIEYRLPILFIK